MSHFINLCHSCGLLKEQTNTGGSASHHYHTYVGQQRNVLKFGGVTIIKSRTSKKRIFQDIQYLSAFKPHSKLHLDCPVLHLPPQ